MFSSCRAGISDYDVDLGAGYQYDHLGWGVSQINHYKISPKGVRVIEQSVYATTYNFNDDYIVYKYVPKEQESKVIQAIFRIKNYIDNDEALPKNDQITYSLLGKGDNFYKDLEKSEIRKRARQILQNSRYSDSISTFGIINKNTHSVDTFYSKKSFNDDLISKKINLKL